jgi:hypothetical protein
METWKPIPEYEGLYEVSDKGQIRSLPRIVSFGNRQRVTPEKVILPYIRPTGYHTVKLGKEGRKQNAYVHRLVTLVFSGPCPPKHEVCHRDGNKSNNRADNLYWGTRKQNIADNIRMGIHPLGEAHGMAKLTDKQVLEIRKDTRPAKEVAESYPVSAAMVRLIKRGLNWSHV